MLDTYVPAHCLAIHGKTYKALDLNLSGLDDLGQEDINGTKKGIRSPLESS